MTDTVRCPACRGSKKVPKLGGMIGECNLCAGKGTILAADKAKTVIVEPVASNTDIINAVAQAVPAQRIVKTAPVEGNVPRDEIEKAVKQVSNDKFVVEVLEPVALPEEPQIKVDGKKAVFRHKKTSAK